MSYIIRFRPVLPHCLLRMALAPMTRGGTIPTVWVVYLLA